MTERGDQVQVVGGVLVRGGRLLLCHRRPDLASYPGVWDLPGGHVEPGETFGEALTRELAEELGVTIRLTTTEPWVSFSLPQLTLHVYVVDRWDGVPANVAQEEHDDIGWFSPSDLDGLNLAHSSYRQWLPGIFE